MTFDQCGRVKRSMGVKRDHWLTALFIIGAVVFLYLHLFILPHVPVLAQGDQAIYLLNAARMLEGQVIYRGFFAFALPGTESVYFILFRLFGVRAWVPDACLIALGVSLAWLSVFISKRLVSGGAVLLPGILVLTLPFRSALDGTHHWYSTLAVVAALAVVIDSRSIYRLVTAGALCGLAGSFTQSAGLTSVLGLACFLIWECRAKRQGWKWLVKSEVSLLASSFVTIVVLNAYFVWKAGLERFLYCTVLFVIKYYPSDWFNTWRVYMVPLPSRHPSLSNLFEWAAFLMTHGLLPLVYLLCFARYCQQAPTRPQGARDRPLLVSMMGLALFFGVAPAPSFLRLCSVSVPAFILLVWLLNQPGRLERAARGLLWGVALTLAVAEPVARQTQWRAFLDLPTGQTAFLDPGAYSMHRWLLERTHPGEFFFGDQLVNLTLGLRDPAQVSFLRPNDYTRPEQVLNLLEVLDRYRVRFVASYHGLHLDSSYLDHPSGDHLWPLRDYLHSHYHIAQTFPASLKIVWERNND